jgi:hypothetical protein
MNRHLLVLFIWLSVPTRCYSANSQARPRFVTFTLAGVNLKSIKQSENETAVIDQKKRYCLSKQTHSKNYYNLLLMPTRELKRNKDSYENRRVSKSKLASLRTGHGISIGSSISQVIEKIGKPSDSETRNGEITYYYRGKFKGWRHHAWYHFAQGRLHSIMIWTYRDL